LRQWCSNQYDQIAAGCRYSRQKSLTVLRQLSIAHRVLDVLMPHPCLDGPRIAARVGQGVAASVPEHVGVDREWHTRAFT
jgi:hypothetical protein